MDVKDLDAQERRIWDLWNLEGAEYLSTPDNEDMWHRYNLTKFLFLLLINED